MIINYSNNIISITSPEINDFIDNIGNYTGLTLNININCDAVVNTQLLINTTDILDNTKPVYIADKILYILPAFISAGNTAFVDGIYNISLSFNVTNGYTKVSNCYFIDVTIKCQVASLLQNIIAENQNSNTEKVSTIAHILHYSLVNGSNCGCNCQEMCDVFAGLQDLLLNVDPKLMNNCGC